MEREIPLEFIGSEQYPLDQDFMVNSQMGDSGARLMIRLNYEFNLVYRLQRSRDEAEAQIKEDVSVLNQVRVFI